MFANHVYLIYMYKVDLALNNLQWLICHKIQPNQAKPNPLHEIQPVYSKPHWQVGVIWKKKVCYFYLLLLGSLIIARSYQVWGQGEWTQ